MKTVNGQAVPEGLPLAELERMLESNRMQTFAVACEALRNAGTREAYALLKRHIDTKDPYKRRYIMSVIFAFDESAELAPYLSEALRGESGMLRNAALTHLVHRNIWVSEEEILSCFEKNSGEIDAYYYQILQRIAKTPAHRERLVRLFRSAKTDSVRIALGECLEAFADKDHYGELFGLMADSNVPKLRLSACRIADQFGRLDLLQAYANDPDGHVRRYVKGAIQKT